MRIEQIVVKVGTRENPTTTGDQKAVFNRFNDLLQKDYPNTPITVVPEHTEVAINGAAI